MKRFNLIFWVSLVLFSSCGKKEHENKVEDGRILFSESAALIIKYTKDLQNVTDSASFDSLTASFEKKLVDLNYKFPPNTDLKLTEQENDSLFKLLQKYKDIRENKFKIKTREVSDSL